MVKSLRTHRSLVKKYILITMGVVLLGLLIFGGILLAFAKEYFDSEAEQDLHMRANIAGAFTNQYLTVFDGQYFLDKTKLLQSLVIFSELTDRTFMLVSADGALELYSGSPVNDAVTISQGILEEAAEGKYFAFNTLEGIFESNYYIVGIPLTSKDGAIYSYMFVASSGEGLTAFLKAVVQVFIIGTIAVLAFTFAVVSIATDKLLAPLGEMSKATRSFAQGDFTKRVPLYGNGYDEISQLALAFNNMASSLAVHEQTRRSFVANVSHELKTPMTTIGGFIDGILDGTIPPDKHQQYLTIVSDEVKRLARLVVSMLNLSRIEAGEMQIHPAEMDISQTVLHTVFALEQSIEAKNLEVIGLDTDKQIVYADPDLIHQVIYNLTDNAVKFVNEGGRLEFSYNQQGKFMYVGIRNSGEGISKEEIPHVFDRFYKTDKSRSQDNGAGLGLYIVKSIVNMHGGDIIVRSVQGEYCEFIVTLPVSKNAVGKTQVAK